MPVVSSIKIGRKLSKILKDERKTNYLKSCIGGASRDIDILIKFLSGETYEKIGNEYGMTRERVRQCLNRAKQNESRLVELVHQEFGEI